MPSEYIRGSLTSACAVIRLKTDIMLKAMNRVMVYVCSDKVRWYYFSEAKIVYFVEMWILPALHIRIDM